MSKFLDYTGLGHFKGKVQAELDKKANLDVIDGLTSDYTTHFQRYIVAWSDGNFTFSSGVCDAYLIPNVGFTKVQATLGQATNTYAAIAFYSTDFPTTGGFMQSSSVRASASKTEYEASVPAGCKSIVVVNRNDVLAAPAISLTAEPNAIKGGKKLPMFEIDGVTADFTDTESGYINWTTGEKAVSGNLTIYKIKNIGFSAIKATLGCNDRVPAAIAFYTTEEISTEGYMASESIRIVNTTMDYYAPVPQEAKLIVVSNRHVLYATPSITLFGSLNPYAVEKVSDVGDITTKAFGAIDGLKQATNKEFLFNGPAYAHLFIEDITQAATPVIPSQSLEDIRIAAKLGYKYIEVNVQTTSDGVMIPIHGDSANFGYEVVDTNGEFTYADTAINSVTYDWIAENIRYRSTITRLKTTIPTLEQFLSECKVNGISVMMTYSTASYALAKKYFGDNFIAYNGNRNSGFTGWIMNYSSLATQEEIIAKCKEVGAPYIHMLTTAAFNTFKNAETLEALAQAVHETGCLLGLASCYHSLSDIVTFFAAGGDVTASNSEVNFPENGNLLNLTDGYTFEEFTTNGTVSGGELALSTGQSVSSPSSEVIAIGKGQIDIRFSGTIIVRNFGHKKFTNATITSDGSKSVRFSTYFLNKAPIFNIEASAPTTVYTLSYKASKC